MRTVVVSEHLLDAGIAGRRQQGLLPLMGGVVGPYGDRRTGHDDDPVRPL